MGDETRSNKSENVHHPQTEVKHPPEWKRDLNPDHMAGQNIGPLAADSEQGLRTAFDVKPLHRRLRAWEDDDLKQIPVIPAGHRLQQGATYLDLNDPSCQEFTALGGMEATPRNAYVPKDRVPYTIWNRLRGIDDVERTAPDTGPARGERRE